MERRKRRTRPRGDCGVPGPWAAGTLLGAGLWHHQPGVVQEGAGAEVVVVDAGVWGLQVPFHVLGLKEKWEPRVAGAPPPPGYMGLSVGDGVCRARWVGAAGGAGELRGQQGARPGEATYGGKGTGVCGHPGAGVDTEDTRSQGQAGQWGPLKAP